MKSRNFAESLKNAMGTMFLLAGAFFVCSTLLSMRAVLADPIAPTGQATILLPQAQRAGTASRPATSRGNSANIVSRGADTTSGVVTQSPRANASSRAVVSRAATTAAVAPATSATTSASRATTTTSGRPTMATSSRGVNAVNAASRGTTSTASRNVVSRGTTNTASRTANGGGMVSRNVISRATTTNPSRISLQGNAIRGSYSTNSNSYTYLSNRLYTGNYSNIIDSSTGLISAEAYNNCMESYYACMDEICTARNAAQRRCACAGRVKAFADAEAKLEQANEELITVSGELALLIATKGKDISAAFQLTEAEQVMNCVSWQEVTKQYGTNSEEAIEWCNNHGIYGEDGGNLTTCSKPKYCSSDGNTFGFNIEDLSGDSSDILAQLQSWAKAKDNTLTILQTDENSLTSNLDALTGVVGNLAGIGGSLSSSDELKDSLAETWGYELFEYAHNNVCNRVLDSCFNGIYEACGTPPDNRSCGNARTICPYNYNSYISVNNTGTYELNFITPSDGQYTASNSATCFGYTSASGDPYADLRGPVADARRSIMQKYALDANADCDLYGEQLSTTAQNIGYQKVAAQQALQQKRLEFYQEEQTEIANNYKTAINNFNECLAELYDCYTTQESSQPNWSTSRIKTYCAQVSNVPHCYQQMICGAPNSTLLAVIDKEDPEDACNNSSDYATNTCRNVITLTEILDGNFAQGAAEDTSKGMREQCLQKYGIDGVRNWTSTNSGANVGWTAVTCPSGQHAENNSCVPDTKSCTHSDAQAATAIQTWNSSTQSWGGCVLQTCQTGYIVQNGQCVQQ